MKRKLKLVGWGLLALMAVALVSLILVGGSIIKTSINTVGPTLLGVPVSVDQAVFMPLRGKLRLTRFHIGNPEGFKTPGLLDVGDVLIELDPKSLLKDTIIIHTIIVTAPEITYEKGLLRSNFSVLMDHLGGGESSPKPEATRKSGDQEKPGKKVIIEKFIVRNPKLKLSITAAMGYAVPIALGQVELTDIGKEQGGITTLDAVKILFSVIVSNVENAVKGAGNLVGDGAKAVFNGAAATVKGTASLIGMGSNEEAPKQK